MRHTEHEVTAADETTLHVDRWSPAEEPRFVVVVAHGGAEHAGRHAWLAKTLAPVGGLVFGPDHRGQGLSGGPRGHVDSFEEYAADLRLCIERTAETLPASQRPDALPWALFGHSMGGLIALTYLLDHARAVPLRGAVISSPLFELAIRANAFQRAALAVGKRVLRRAKVPGSIPADAICRDPEEVARYEADHRRARWVTFAWFDAFERAAARVEAEIGGIELPMRWAIGTADRVCDHHAMQRVFGRLRDPEAREQTLEVHEGYYHELHNEPAQYSEPVHAAYRDWLLARCDL